MLMVSPFPGMDPYLEWHWGDVHTRVMTYACDVLQEHLPTDLYARLEERVYLEAELDVLEKRLVVPDVRVISVRRPTSGAVAVAEPPLEPMTDPVVLRAEHEPLTESYIEIRDSKSGGRVVTLIEVVSPGNKSGGQGEAKYRQKQREMQQAGANVVEIDLIRGGRDVLAFPVQYVPPQYATPNKVCVVRASQADQAEWYPIPLRAKLPRIRVPLRPTDSDVPLDLQLLIDRAYRNGRYANIDYTRDPIPPLIGEDAAWADELLKSKGLR